MKTLAKQRPSRQAVYGTRVAYAIAVVHWTLKLGGPIAGNGQWLVSLRKSLKAESLDFTRRTTAADSCVKSMSGIENNGDRPLLVQTVQKHFSWEFARVRLENLPWDSSPGAGAGQSFLNFCFGILEKTVLASANELELGHKQPSKKAPSGPHRRHQGLRPQYRQHSLEVVRQNMQAHFRADLG